MAWIPGDDMRFTVCFENGIDESPLAAWQRLERTDGHRFVLYAMDDLGGEEREMPCVVTMSGDGLAELFFPLSDDDEMRVPDNLGEGSKTGGNVAIQTRRFFRVDLVVPTPDE